MPPELATQLAKAPQAAPGAQPELPVDPLDPEDEVVEPVEPLELEVDPVELEPEELDELEEVLLELDEELLEPLEPEEEIEETLEPEEELEELLVEELAELPDAPEEDAPEEPFDDDVAPVPEEVLEALDEAPPFPAPWPQPDRAQRHKEAVRMADNFMEGGSGDRWKGSLVRGRRVQVVQRDYGMGAIAKREELDKALQVDVGPGSASGAVRGRPVSAPRAARTSGVPRRRPAGGPVLVQRELEFRLTRLKTGSTSKSSGVSSGAWTMGHPTAPRWSNTPPGHRCGCGPGHGRGSRR